jgi:hypothetical protein
MLLAAAILDPLLRLSTMLNIRGHSYRLCEKRIEGAYIALTASERGRNQD